MGNINNGDFYTGKNGIPVKDNGESWRAFNPSHDSIIDPQPYPYKGHGGFTGVYFYMGFDPSADAGKGGTRIAYVDYPKDRYTLEETINGDDVPFILMNCNVCSAMDEAAKRFGRLPYESKQESRSVVPYARVESGPVSESQQPQQYRVSFAPAMAATIPKLIPKLIKITKSIALKPAGDVALTVGLSFLSEMLSAAVSNPDTRLALQSFSDDMVDMLDDDIASRITEQAIEIGEAALRDGDNISNKKLIMGAIFKNRGDLKKDLDAAKASRAATATKSKSSPAGDSTFSFTPSPSAESGFNFDNNRAGSLNIPRLFE
jgi:hypothetical protein